MGEEGGVKRDSHDGKKREKSGKNYTTLCNILQSKKHTEAGAKEIVREPGQKGTGCLTLLPPLPPLPPDYYFLRT